MHSSRVKGSVEISSNDQEGHVEGVQQTPSGMANVEGLEEAGGQESSVESDVVESSGEQATTNLL